MFELERLDTKWAIEDTILDVGNGVRRYSVECLKNLVTPRTILDPFFSKPYNNEKNAKKVVKMHFYHH